MLITIGSMALIGCANHPPMKTVANVDLPKFMGDWYVIANIPTFIEKEAYNAVESYQLDADGNIPTTFTFNKGSFTGPQKVHSPKGFVKNEENNAEWGMQFVWPIKADYRIVYLNADYSQVIIGRNARDYVWVMARKPKISDTDYQGLKERVAELGYDLNKLRKVPQQALSDR